MIAEVKAARALTDAQRERIAALEAEVSGEQKNSASLSASYAAATREIEQLRTSVAYLEKAINLHEQTIAILQTEGARLKADARKSRRRAAIATLISIASVASRFIH